MVETQRRVRLLRSVDSWIKRVKSFRIKYRPKYDFALDLSQDQEDSHQASKRQVIYCLSNWEVGEWTYLRRIKWCSTQERKAEARKGECHVKLTECGSLAKSLEGPILVSIVELEIEELSLSSVRELVWLWGRELEVPTFLISWAWMPEIRVFAEQKKYFGLCV